MADKRKLQGDIERNLKRVQEGRLAFQEILEKFEASTNQTQKEKFEGDLKKEIKKLQRLRDQIKTWLTSNEVKDKRPLLEARKEIEQDMERFKVIEKETKTKAYSKEGLLSTDSKKDPLQKEKEELEEWLKQSISLLQTQSEKYEFEIESLSTSNKKKRVDKDKAATIEDKRQRLDTCTFHTEKLETIMRHLDNERLDCGKVRSIKDPVEYVVESVDDQSNQALSDYRSLYDDLHLDELGDTTGLAPGTAPEHDGSAVFPPVPISRLPSTDETSSTPSIPNFVGATSSSPHVSVSYDASSISLLSTAFSTTPLAISTTTSSASSNASTSRERGKFEEKLSHGSVTSTSTPVKAVSSGDGACKTNRPSGCLVANLTAPPSILSQRLGNNGTSSTATARTCGRSFTGTVNMESSNCKSLLGDQYPIGASKSTKSECSLAVRDKSQKIKSSAVSNGLLSTEHSNDISEAALDHPFLSLEPSFTSIQKRRSNSRSGAPALSNTSSEPELPFSQATQPLEATDPPVMDSSLSLCEESDASLSVRPVVSLPLASTSPELATACSSLSVPDTSLFGHQTSVSTSHSGNSSLATAQMPPTLMNAAILAMAQMKAQQSGSLPSTGSTISSAPLIEISPEALASRLGMKAASNVTVASNNPTNTSDSGTSGSVGTSQQPFVQSQDQQLPHSSGKSTLKQSTQQVQQRQQQQIQQQSSQPPLALQQAAASALRTPLAHSPVGLGQLSPAAVAAVVAQQQVAAAAAAVVHNQQQTQQQVNQQRNPSLGSSIITQMHPRDAAAPFRNRNLDKVKNGAHVPELFLQLQALETGYRRLPLPCDTEKARMIICKNLVNAPSYYPREPMRNTDTEEYYARLDAQTLFFIFYYFEGTKAQYLAAKALKRMSWRFHTKYMMWFQRHEEPKQITDEYESGTYIYYDFKTMSQRKKEEFVFHYSFLEDKDF